MSAEPTTRPRPAFDPDVARALAEHADDLVTSMTPEQVLEVRGRAPLAPDPTDGDLSRGGQRVVMAVQVPGAPGSPDVPLVLCLPAAAVLRPVPVVLYLHGGGLVSGNLRRDLPAVLDLVDGLGLGPDDGPGPGAPAAGGAEVAVVSVGYRLAPETPYPGAVEDAYAGLVWLAAQASGLGLDPGRLVVAGTSAGGGLAAATVLLARDRGGPPVAAQLLLCPMLDDRNDSVSAHQMAGAGVWDRTANATGWAALLGDLAGTPDVPAYAAPARAGDLSGLPPTYVDVGSADTFRDEDVAYASGIWAAGGDAELHVWPGGCHGFDGLAPGSALAQDAVRARRSWLRRVLRARTAGAPDRPSGHLT